LAFAIAICLWLLALNSNKTFFWSSDFVPGLPIPFASPAAASKAQVLFLFDQMIDLDLEFLFTKGRERGSGVLLDVPNHHLGLPAFASDKKFGTQSLPS